MDTCNFKKFLKLQRFILRFALLSLLFQIFLFLPSSAQNETDKKIFKDESIHLENANLTYRKGVKPLIKKRAKSLLLKEGTIVKSGGLGTYYLSPLGDDSNAGTSPDQAWQTIDKINSIDFEPGDRIYFQGGETFQGNILFDLNDSGTLTDSIYLDSYGSERAIIDAQNGTGFEANGSSFIQIKNLNFRGNGRNDGNEGDGVLIESCTDVSVDSVDIYGFQHSGLVVSISGSNFRFTNIYAYENGYYGICIIGENKTSVTNAYFGYCVADNNPGDPTVTTSHSGSGILAYNASDVIIEYCKASNNGWDMQNINNNGPGGIWVAEVDNVLIQYCISHDNKTPAGKYDGLGFDLDGGTTNSTIQYCLSYNNHGAGFGIFQYSNATDWGNNTIRYCISENDGNVTGTGSVIVWNGTSIGSNFEGFEFYNNVIYNTSGPALSFLDNNNSNFNFRNNIFVSKDKSVYNGISGETFQANCWFSLNGLFQIGAVTYDFETWAQDNNNEMLNGEIVGMYANPLLKNPGSSTLTDPTILSSVDDYELTESSPLINSGLDLNGEFGINPGSQDYFGNSIKHGPEFDMGIHEFVDPDWQNQTIGLTEGWNIISSRVLPNDSNMLNIMQPLIDAGLLNKVIDEAGKVIEDYGSENGGWQNNIGNLKKEEGYNINVIGESILEIEGYTVNMPFSVPLSTGWNIISWPTSEEQNGIDVVQPLIDEGKLIKVLNESGQVIEDYGIENGGWLNYIGNFKPGEGYKINVTSECVLTLSESYAKSDVIVQGWAESKYFVPAYKGNGTDHMSINLIDIKGSGIEAGDEIGVFDGNICVGSTRILNQVLLVNNQFSNISIPVSAADGVEIDNGFSNGNNIEIRVYKNSKEYKALISPLNNSKLIFEKGSSLFAKIDFATKADDLQTMENVTLNCYPNPFRDEINIVIGVRTASNVQIDILNQLGQLVEVITDNANLASGQHFFKWDGNVENGTDSFDIFYVRININGSLYHRKIIDIR